MNVSELKNLHYGEPAFCIGSAPHLNDLDLSSLKGFVTIGCNQLALIADQYDFDYVCFQRDVRFRELRDKLPQTHYPKFIIPDSILRKHEKSNWRFSGKLKERICSCHIRFTSPEHAEVFSFDLENCVYAGDSLAIEIQFAVWMGCNPIYVLGVDAQYRDSEDRFFDHSLVENGEKDRIEQYVFPDLRQWLKKTKTLLWSRGIEVFNAAGTYSSLDVLPRMRLRAAIKKPRIAVTSKTFSQDAYLVKELERYFSDPVINNSDDKLQGEKLIEFLKDADGVILGTESFTADIMAALPCLRFVSKYGVGLDNIDFEACKRNEIEVAYKKGVNSNSVAELTLAFVLMLIRNVDVSISSFRRNQWKKLAGKELAEMTVGVIGYGHVGKVVAEKLGILGVGRILANDLIDFQNTPPVEFVPLDYLLKESDIVTLHVTMEKQNYHMVNDKFLHEMKEGSFLINTSRGEVLDSEALVKALRAKHLAGAALDVYEKEPEIDEKLRSCPNLLTTCHIAGSSNRSIKSMGWAAIEGLLKLFNISPY